MEIPLPPPRNIKVKFSIGDKWTTISRPSANTFPLADVPFVILFKTLGIANVLTLFKCLLLEEKVGVMCNTVTLPVIRWCCIRSSIRC
jgi:hypothetical protein